MSVPSGLNATGPGAPSSERSAATGAPVRTSHSVDAPAEPAVVASRDPSGLKAVHCLAQGVLPPPVHAWRVVVSQTRTPPSAPATARWPPSALYATDMPSPCSSPTGHGTGVSPETSHRRSGAALPVAASVAPSGLNATECTSPGRPRSTASCGAATAARIAARVSARVPARVSGAGGAIRAAATASSRASRGSVAARTWLWATSRRLSARSRWARARSRSAPARTFMTARTAVVATSTTTTTTAAALPHPRRGLAIERSRSNTADLHGRRGHPSR